MKINSLILCYVCPSFFIFVDKNNKGVRYNHLGTQIYWGNPGGSRVVLRCVIIVFYAIWRLWFVVPYFHLLCLIHVALYCVICVAIDPFHALSEY